MDESQSVRILIIINKFHVIIECLLFTAQQNIAQWRHKEYQDHIDRVSDINHKNFPKLLDIQYKDINWLVEMLQLNLHCHT